MSPFTFTKDLVKRKNYFKRTAYIMQARPPLPHASHSRLTRVRHADAGV